jgi:hypothetical protein
MHSECQTDDDEFRKQEVELTAKIEAQSLNITSLMHLLTQYRAEIDILKRTSTLTERKENVDLRDNIYTSDLERRVRFADQKISKLACEV